MISVPVEAACKVNYAIQTEAEEVTQEETENVIDDSESNEQTGSKLEEQVTEEVLTEDPLLGQDFIEPTVAVYEGVTFFTMVNNKDNSTIYKEDRIYNVNYDEQYTLTATCYQSKVSIDEVELTTIKPKKSDTANSTEQTINIGR